METPQQDHEQEKIERLRQAMYSRATSEKLRPRERRYLGEERSDVGDDWKREEPELQGLVVAPRHMSVGRNVLLWFLGGAFLFFLGAVGFFGYYFLFGGGSLPASPENIDIAISGPPQVSGGEPTQLQVVVTNRNKIPLELADLVITYPPGTRSPTDYTSDLPNQRITLGTIEPGGRRQGTISAIFDGAEGQRATVGVELEYRTTGSNSIFVAHSSYGVNFSSSPITLHIDGNTQTIAGQTIQLTATVSSNANAPIKDVVLAVDLPFGFTLNSAAPKRSGTGVWEMGDFTPGEKRVVTLVGTMKGQGGDERAFRFSVGTRSSSKPGIDAVLATQIFKTSISQPFLNLKISTNGATGKNTTVSPGDKLTVLIEWENNLSSPITNAVVVAKLSGLQIDGSTLKTQDGFYRSSDDSVFWDKTTTNGVLANLSAGQKGSLAFTFSLPNSDEMKGMVNPHLDISVNAAGSRISETNVPESLQSTVRQTISLASDLQLVAEGLYYTNPFGSTGPMPPKAGSETTYALVFTVRNTTNKISNAVLTATLPPYIRWVGIYSPASEKLTFNQSDGTVKWTLGDIDPGVGLDATAPRQAAIAIGFTPSTSQIGSEPILLQDIKLVGRDVATGAPISKEITDITTNLMKVSKSSEDIITAGDQGFTATNATVVK
ncbi:MAG: hypothetical protein RIQ56_973 [Candidatus Parcubacteria bacterium]|jgi:hypothetical protein